MKQPFTAAEFEVMQALWKHGALKPREIQAVFPRPIRNAALRSILLILLEKGHVNRRKSGRAYVYETATPQRGALRKMARRLAESFCGGSTSALIAQLLKSEKLSAQDIRELQQILAGKATTAAARPRKGKSS